MKGMALLCAVFLILPSILASEDITVKAVKAYEVSKWEYFKVGIRNYGDGQRLLVKVRGYDASGYEKYTMINGDMILYREDKSAFLVRPVFVETASDWWPKNDYKEILLRWIVSPCNCKRFIEFPMIIVIEVYKYEDLKEPADKVWFLMWSEFYYGTG